MFYSLRTFEVLLDIHQFQMTPGIHTYYNACTGVPEILAISLPPTSTPEYPLTLGVGEKVTETNVHHLAQAEAS